MITSSDSDSEGSATSIRIDYGPIGDQRKMIDEPKVTSLNIIDANEEMKKMMESLSMKDHPPVLGTTDQPSSSRNETEEAIHRNQEGVR